MGRASAMEVSAMLLIVLHISLTAVDEGHAINPGCECVRFRSTYGKPRGTFSSPDYPRPYPPHLGCLLYTFQAAPYEIVEIIFTDFDIYKAHLDCTSGDYLKVYTEVGGGGVNEYSEWSRALCGGRDEMPPPLYSAGPALVLEFHTAPGRRRTNSTGFLGTFAFIDRRLFETDGARVAGTECDYQFMSAPHRPAHGRLYSPRYPSSYPNNIRCSYRFHARQNERIKVVFEEISLQKGDISCLNRADIVKAFDGRTPAAPVIAMLCNEVSGYEVLSTGADLLLQFTANSDWPGQGFKASFQFQPVENKAGSADGDTHPRSSVPRGVAVIGPEVSAATSTCHQVFSSDSVKNGTLTSPLYPTPYLPNTYCHYDFFGRGKERVRIDFEDFSLYKPVDNIPTTCDNVDSLQAYVHVDGRQEKVEGYCGGERPAPLMSNGPKLMLEFRGTHSSRHARGFKLRYSFVQNFGITSGRQLQEFPCAFVYNSSEARNGTFTSPNHPGHYPRDTECNYFFYGAETEKVHLHFVYFDVEGVLPCEAISASDFVEFSNKLVDDNKFPRHCGQLKDFHLESEGKFFKVTFKSNDRLDSTGFRANYQFLESSDTYQPPPVDDSTTHYYASCYLVAVAVLRALYQSFK